MITNFNNYITEKTNLNNFNLSQNIINNINKRLSKDYKINNNFKYEILSNLDDSINHLLNGNSILIKKNNDIIIFIDIISNREIHIYSNRHIFMLNKNMLKQFITENILDENTEYFLLKNFILHTQDKDVVMYRYNQKSITNYFKLNYENILHKMYDSYIDIIKHKLNITDKKHIIYIDELEYDLEQLIMYKRSIFIYSHFDVLLKKVSNKLDIDLDNKKLDTTTINKICRSIFLEVFINNNKLLKIINYKFWKNEIKKDTSAYKRIKQFLHDPELIDLFKHLDNANKFDII